MTITALTDAATIAWDGSPGNAFTVTIASNRTMATPSNLTPGQLYTLAVTQGPSGHHTLTWSSAYLMSYGAAPALSASAGSVDVLEFLATSASSLALVAEARDVQSTVLPAAPTGLTASIDQTAQVTLAWTNNATDATEIDVQLNDMGAWALLATVTPSTTSYVDVYGSSGSGTYRIVAVRGTVDSSPSNTADGTAL